MASWRQYQLGGRVRGLQNGTEERLALDRSAGRAPARSAGRPVTIRIYPRAAIPNIARALVTVRPDPHLARPLELAVEVGEVLVVRELSFGPSLGDVIGAGPQPEAVVAAILDQLLDALAVLHTAGALHLRLSPEAVRFDLLSGTLKLGDLEEAALLPEPRADLIPRFLEPDVRVGLGTAASDVFSVGRIGEALLRGGSPLGAWGAAPPSARAGAMGALWTFLMRCQGALADVRPVDGTAALVALRALGIAPAGGATLPLAKFVRSHVGALRELRRWRAQPLPPLEETAGRGYREVLSAGEAAKLWGGLGAAGFAAVLFSIYLAGAPARGSEMSTRFSEDACSEDVHASVVATPEAAPKDFVVATLQLPPEAAVAVDGCALTSVTPGDVLLAVEPGLHDLRVAVGGDILTTQLEAKVGSHPAVDFRVPAQPRGDAIAALGVLAKDLGQPAEEAAKDFDPLEVGMLEPSSRHLIAVDAVEVEPKEQLRNALPDSVALALDGLRAALRRFKVTEVDCAGKLTAAVDKALGPSTGDVDETDLRKAVAVLTVTRIRGPQLKMPLRIEAEALAELGVTPGRRLLSTVADLAADPAITTCLATLDSPVHQINTLSGLVLGQIPGVSDEGETEDRESSE